MKLGPYHSEGKAMDDHTSESSTPVETIDHLATNSAIAILMTKARRGIAYIESGVRTIHKKAESEYQRAAQLGAYRLRKVWKRGDESKLNAIGINAVARRRFERVKQSRCLGRPAIPNYLNFDQVIKKFVRKTDKIFNPLTPPHLRSRTLKETNWWPYFVEAVYRGEYAMAKAERKLAASAHAEEVTGKSFGIGTASVRKIAGQVRRVRAQGIGLPDSPSLLASDFEVWKRTGRFPERSAREIGFVP